MAFVTVYQGAGGRIDLEYTYTQSIPNNTTTLTVKAYVVKTNSSYYSYNNGVNFRLTVAGSNINYNWSFNFSKMTLNTRYLITSATRTLSHNSDGTHGNVSVSVYSATNTSGLGTISGSTSISIPTIPRASTLNSFSFASALQIGTAVTINLSISRHSSSFTHDIQLRDGSTVLQSWNGQGVPTSLTVSASTVNTMLSRMSTVTSKTFTLRVQTKSGSTNIGSAVTRNATVSVHSSVTPTATGLKVSVYGSGRDKTINKFVQNISRVTSSFTGTARGGASVSSRKIVIRRASDGSNSQTINSGSGTTSGRVTLSGTYEAIATVTDSRGRSATQRVTFTVHAYSPPKVTSFTAVRNSSTPTTVNIGRYGSWSALGGDNPITIVIKRGSTIIQNVTGTDGTVSGTLVDTGRSVTSSYTYTLTLTDTFGNSASASATVSTDKVVLDIHKNEGVGVGKMHEQGALDVGGEAYINGSPIITLAKLEAENLISKEVKYYSSSNPDADADTILDGSFLITILGVPGIPISGDFVYIIQFFYTVGSISTTSNRVQIAFGYNYDGMAIRRYRNGWHPWRKVMLE